MPKTEVGAVDRSVEKANLWLEQLAEELDGPADRAYAVRVLRAVLHALHTRRGGGSFGDGPPQRHPSGQKPLIGRPSCTPDRTS